MDLELQGKSAIVTGSTRGIGKHIAIALAREGCNVAISGRTEETLIATGREIRDLGVKVLEVRVDLSDGGAVERLVEETFAAFNRVDVLVNCVGGGRGGQFVNTTDEDW